MYSGSMPNHHPQQQQPQQQQQQQMRGNMSRGYGGGGQGQHQGQGGKRQQRGPNNYSGNDARQYNVRGRTKKGQGRLHEARVDNRNMGRGYHDHHAMPQRRPRGYQQEHFRQGPSGQGQVQGRGSAFGFPNNAVPQNQANNNQVESPDEKGMSLQMMSPGSSNGSHSGNGGNMISPNCKTPTMIDHVVDRVFYIAKTQSGSRFVQEKLTDKQYFELFFKELKEHVADLMVDNFGHYAIEALFSHCDDQQRLELLENLKPKMSMVACHKQGSFSIQAMMDTLSTKEHIQCLIEALNGDVKRVILNHSGHYVILRFLQRFDWPSAQFIHQPLQTNTLDLATDHYGLRVMKAAVDAGPAQDMRLGFMAVVKHANTLVENQYGNYIVQHLLDLAPQDVTDLIKEKMHGKFVRYSKQKFSSNVVEKCLRHSSTQQKQGVASKDWITIIVRELLAKAGDLISDKYGNYCLQTALQVAIEHPTLLQEFDSATKPFLDTLRENVKAKWCKLLDGAIDTQQKMRRMGGPMASMNMQLQVEHDQQMKQ